MIEFMMTVGTQIWQRKRGKKKESQKAWKINSMENQRLYGKWWIRENDFLRSKDHQKQVQYSKMKKITQVASRSEIKKTRVDKKCLIVWCGYNALSKKLKESQSCDLPQFRLDWVIFGPTNIYSERAFYLYIVNGRIKSHKHLKTS